MSTITANATRLIAQNNAAVACAAGVALTADGMALLQVRRPGATCLAIVVSAFGLLTLAKVAMVLTMGDTAYGAAISLMQHGTLADGAAAWAMGVDNFTAALVNILR